MIVFVNGERVDCGDARTIEELIQRHQLPPETTLVEHNGRRCIVANGLT